MYHKDRNLASRRKTYKDIWGRVAPGGHLALAIKNVATASATERRKL